MIILHAGTSEGTLVLWGEASAPAGGCPVRRKGRGAKAPQSNPFPYDPGLEGLSLALDGIAGAPKVLDERARAVIVWLPTKGNQPLPSSPMIAEMPCGSKAPTLAPWVATAFSLNSEETIQFLCAVMGKKMLAPGMIVGRDLAFWAQALRFAGMIVAHQQYLPGVIAENGTYRARWEPVFTGVDAERMTRLARAMPPSARALSTSKTDLPPQKPAIRVLKELISEMVDRLVRIASSMEGPPKGIGGDRRKDTSAFHSVHDAWLHALRTPDGAIAGDRGELSNLAAQIGEWRRPISISVSSPFRLCFRLEEPESFGPAQWECSPASCASREVWYVRFLLQPRDDLSLLIPLKDIWRPREINVQILERCGLKAREYLFSALGQAAGICPRIERSLRTAEPAGYELDTSGAHEFLTEKALALEQAGFGVMLPAWWTRRGTKQRLSVRANVKSPRMQVASGLSLDQIVEFDWEVALGGEKLTPQELEELARMKSPLVRLRGQWVEMSAEEIQAALEFWRKETTGSATVREIIRMALGATDRLRGIEFEGVWARGWIANLLRELEGEATLDEQESPKGFSGTLRPYQIRGYSWLAFLRRWGLGACLADDMGLGKTIQMLALIQRDWETNAGRPVLVICPTSVVSNWQKEAARFTPQLPVMVHHGIERKKGAAFEREAQKSAIVLSSYALLHRDIEHLQKMKWTGVVLDEAQNIKNPQTQQARAARALKAEYRVALTGTPVENNIQDLWSIMEFLNPGLLGSQAHFRQIFFIPIQAGRDPMATERLKRITGPFILRRLKTDKAIIADLPEKMEMKVFCTLTREQASLYAAVLKNVEEALEYAEGIGRRGLILGTLSKLKQVCNHPAQFLGDNSTLSGRSGKLARLAEMLEEILEVGDRVLIFSQFAEMGHILHRYLQETFGCEVLFLHGGVSKRQRDSMVERFQSARNGAPIFILSLKAGGTGLNLTAASHVFHFDRWWNPAVENQATDRAFRIGQMRNVQVHKFVCAGTLEEKIDEMIERKKEIAEKVIGTGEGWITELSNNELREIFALRREALGD